MENCDALESFEKECLNNLGGLYQMIYNDQDELDVTVDPVTNMVTAIVHNSVCQSISLRKGQGNFTEPSAIDLVAGSSLTTGTINMNPTRRNAAKSRALKVMGQGQRYLGCFCKDGNGLWWYFPEMQLSNAAGGSGTTKAEGSKYEITLVNEVALEDMAYAVDEALILPLLSPPAP